MNASSPPLADVDWAGAAASLDAVGCAVIGPLLDPAACAALIACYDEERHFRSRVVMARHGFGRGEYQYFGYPLPEPVAALRTSLYVRLAPIANAWNEAMGLQVRYPAEHAAFLARCDAAGQTRPTPLLLRYGVGDYNRLHQDVYGALVFPLQVVVMLDQPGVDFTGGELVLVEGRARMQSRPVVVAWGQGDGVVIPVRERPVRSARGWSRAAMRHGVAEIRGGVRRTLGVIFHDAA